MSSDRQGRQERGTAGFAAAVFCILALALLPRLVSLANRPLGSDEFLSAVFTFLPGSVWDLAASPTSPDAANPPLYFLLLKSWVRFFGLSPWGLRSLSLLLGLLQIGMLGAFAASLQVSRRAVLWTMGLGACASLQIYYSTEARAYMLLLVLLTGSMTAFILALRRGGAIPWIAHGALLALALYTHNIAAFAVLPFWLVLPVLRVPSRAYAKLLVVHLLVAVVYLPWIPVIISQANSEAYQWNRRFSAGVAPMEFLWSSIKGFGVGARTSQAVNIAPVADAVHALSLILFLGAGLFVFDRWGGGRDDSAASGEGFPRRRRIGALLVFLVTLPLLTLTFTLLKAPIYTPGRYDLPAQIAYLVLVGIGMERLQERLLRGPLRILGLLLPGLVALLTVGSFLPYFARPRGTLRENNSALRGEILRKYLTPDDIVVTTGLMTAEILYQLKAGGMEAKVLTFPASQMGHMGWYNPGDLLRDERPSLGADADGITSTKVLSGADPRLIWVFFRKNQGSQADHQAVLTILQDALAHSGRILTYPPGEERRWQSLGVYPYCAVGERG